MASDAEVFDLIEAGFLRDAASTLDKRSELAPSILAVRNQLEFHIGSIHRARANSERLLKSRIDHPDKSRCWETVGRAAFSAGEVEAGQKAFKLALAAAGASRDATLESRIQASYLEGLLHCVGIESATVEIPALRRMAVHAGDAYSLTWLHSLVAEIQTKTGALAAARLSVERGRALLKRFDNLLLLGRLEIVSSAIDILESDYASALAHTSEALSCARRSGSLRLRNPALVNLAHIKVAQDRLDDAKEALRELASWQRGGTEIAVLGTELQVAVAAGDFETAGSLIRRLSEVSANLESGHSYYGLWFLLARVKWRYRVNDAEAGLAEALESIPYVKRAADRNLLERMQLLAAEGLGRTGRALEGAHLLAEAVNGNTDPPLEMIAEASRIAGRLTAVDNPRTSRGHFARAARILERIENFTALADVRRDAAETLDTSEFPSDLAAGGNNARPILSDRLRDSPSSSERMVFATITERVASVTEVGGHPQLLAVELLSLIEDSGCAQYAAAVEALPEETLESNDKNEKPGFDPAFNDHPNTVRIPTGTLRGRQHVVLAVPNSTPASRTTLLSVQRLASVALAIARAKQEIRERATLWAQQTPEQQLGLVSASERMLEIVTTIRRVAPSNLTVLLTGETGVGKELFARALHMASPRKDRTFLPFNCTAVSRDMLDSQLFGHRRGAFTGAHEEGPGVIRAAAGGTLFLDEIGEMSAEAQPKLLRFLESGDILPLGESKPIHVDVRVVAATNANLDQLVQDGRFREDLYYRLNVLPIHIPPLRERREEIPALVEHFLEQVGREQQKPMLRVADDTLEYLLLYRWPGNVRQLANEIRRMAALAEPGAMLLPAHLSKDIVASRRTIPVQPSEMVMPLDQTLAAATEQLERAVIERALKICDGRNDEAARVLGLSRKGLYLKRQRLGV